MRFLGGGTRMLVLAAATLLWAGGAAAEGRVALLIGNASYADPAFDLRNPGKDAAAMAAALAPLGFTTDVVVDADRATARAALAAFAAKAADAEVALFFFAGHGVQIQGENRLLTAGFDKLDAAEIDRESLSLEDVRAALKAAHPALGLIVLDACRNNPLSRSGLAAQGLARAQGGSGLLIAYATDPGNVAYDGTGENSVFTSALVDTIGTPGLEVRLMFGRARQAVVLASGGLQVPWVEEAVLGEHYLNPAPAPAQPDTAIAADVEAWRAATASGDPEAYQHYLDDAPEGLFRAFARERITELSSAPAAPAPDAATVLAGADPAQLGAALSTLGFLAAPRGMPADPDELRRAFDAYAQQVGGGRADLDGLYLDAAQVTVMLGASTAQRIRTDMAALASIDTTLGMADRARGQLAGLAATEPAAGTALVQADSDIAAIRAARDKVLARLDQSRTYYSDLVARGSTDFRPYLSRSLAGLLDRSRSLPGFEGRVVEDAGRFVQHASADGVDRAQGSMAWLADFLPGS